MSFERAKLGLYNAFLMGMAPALLAKKTIKFGRRGHKHEWDFARWTAPRAVRNGHQTVVLVALSWGEVAILDQISRRLEARCPQIALVWSIRDQAAQQMASAAFPNRKIVPMPFDFALPVRRWLDAVQPDFLVIIEKFWWPNLVWGAKLRGARVALVNGRSRGREKTRYQWMSGFQKWVLEAFDLLLFESDSQIERVSDVLPQNANVKATGNIKFAFETPAPPSDEGRLRAWIEARPRNKNGALPLLIAGSTSEIDEKWALHAFAKVRENHECCLLIAPRRPSRADEVASYIQKRGYSVSRRTLPTENAEVLLLDTLGELFYVYRFGTAAYVGGAVEGRGHNIIEPLAWGIPVGYGPNRGDFESAQRAAEDVKVGFRLQNSDDLADFWNGCLQNDELGREVKENAEILLARQKGALEKTVEALQALLESPQR